MTDTDDLHEAISNRPGMPGTGESAAVSWQRLPNRTVMNYALCIVPLAVSAPST